MTYTFGDLRNKEVIHIGDGERLGFVSDIEIDSVTGRVLSLRVPGAYRALGLLGREPERIIPWECIKKIGDDFVMIENLHRYREKQEAPLFVQTDRDEKTEKEKTGM